MSTKGFVAPTSSSSQHLHEHHRREEKAWPVLHEEARRGVEASDGCDDDVAVGDDELHFRRASFAKSSSVSVFIGFTYSAFGSLPIISRSA